MVLSPSEQLLIDALSALPANNVYADAGKREIINGFRLFADRRVSEIGWQGDGVLLLELAASPDGGASSAAVRVSRERGSLRWRCSHPEHDGSERCGHVVCAVLTLVHLFRPDLFKRNYEDPEYRRRLEAGLYRRSVQPGGPRRPFAPFVVPAAATGEAKRREARFEVIIEATPLGLNAFVEKDSVRIGERPYGGAMPPEIAYLVRSSYGQDMSLPLAVFLKRAEGRYPVYFGQCAPRRRVEWLGDARCPVWTELDAREGEIVARKACSLEKDRSDPGRLIGNFVFNEERTRMVQVPRGSEGWYFYELIKGSCQKSRVPAARLRHADGREFAIPGDVFGGLQLFLGKTRTGQMARSLSCMVEGAPAQVGAALADVYAIVVSADRRGKFVIKPECRSAGHSFRPSQVIVSLVRAVERGRVPFAVRTKKRKPVFYDALFGALALDGKKAVDAYLERTIDWDAFGRRESASHARSLIRQALRAFAGEDTQLRFTGREWQLISVDKAKEKRLFAIPYEVFGPSLFGRIAHHGVDMSVSEEELVGRLHRLHGLCEEARVELSFDGQPIERVSWDFMVDATGGAIDWFEIRPEIKYKGEPVPMQVWEQALTGKGIIAQGGKIQYLDEASMRHLALVASLLGGTKKRAGRREVASIPRLRIIDLFALRKKGIPVRLTDEDEAIMARLTGFTGIGERPVPGLKAELRHYQREGYHWLAFLYENGFGACLADDMGLGKTVQAVCLLAAVKEGKVAPRSRGQAGLKTLVVVPSSLIFNWEREIERFYPDLSVRVYRGRRTQAGSDDYDVLIASYGLVRRHIGKLKQVAFGIIIFDEAQAVKNIFSDTTHAVRQLKGVFKVALTGTPVENHLGEYFSIMDLLLPGLLGEYREFQGRAKADAAAVLPMLKERTRPFVLRRTKERILKELPPKLERDVYLDLTEEQKKFYNRTVAEVRATVAAAYRLKAAEQARIIALAAIMKLRQICLSPQLLVPELQAPAPKVEFLKEKLGELCRASHSSLVFSQFTTFLDIVEAELRTQEVPVFRLDGSTPVAKRKGIVDAFQKSASPSVFLLSMKAGGQGLNLTRGDYVFHLDPWWNPAVESQASDRSHRIGQKKKVIVTRLLMRHTIEEKMTALKARKAALYQALMDGPEGGADRAITGEDFEFLLE